MFNNSLITYNGIEFSFSDYSAKSDLSLFHSPLFQNPRNGMWMRYKVGQNDDKGDVTYVALEYDGADRPIRESYSVYDTDDVISFIRDTFRDDLCLEGQSHDDAFEHLRPLMGF